MVYLQKQEGSKSKLNFSIIASICNATKSYFAVKKKVKSRPDLHKTDQNNSGLKKILELICQEPFRFYCLTDGERRGKTL